MFYVSEVTTQAPKEFKTGLQEKVYDTLNKLNIPFTRVDNDDALTMEDCIVLNEKLDVEIVKTLFVCNRQQTNFYLFVTKGDKPFVTKDFSKALGISRVSFATPDKLLEMMHTRVGAATVFSALADPEHKVVVVIDKEVLSYEWFGCTDGTPSSYMRVKTSQIMNDFLNYTGHKPIFAEV